MSTPHSCTHTTMYRSVYEKSTLHFPLHSASIDLLVFLQSCLTKKGVALKLGKVAKLLCSPKKLDIVYVAPEDLLKTAPCCHSGRKNRVYDPADFVNTGL